MKKPFFLAFALTVFTTSVFCQRNSNLKGPQAKNYKIWEDDDKSSSTAVYTVYADNIRETGPSVKNRKPGDKKANAVSYAVVANSRPKGVTGPKVKNQKIWSTNDTNARHAIAEETVVEDAIKAHTTGKRR